MSEGGGAIERRDQHLFQDFTIQCVYITLFNLQGTLNNANI